MKFGIHWQKLTRPRQDAHSWALLLGAAGYWVLALLMVPSGSGVRFYSLWLPPCPLKAVTGIPCPFCGLTTGSAWMARGLLKPAWESNILSPMMMAGAGLLAGYVLLFRFAAARVLRFDNAHAIRKAAWFAAALLVALSWIANLLRK